MSDTEPMTGRALATVAFGAAGGQQRGGTYLALKVLRDRGLVWVDNDAYPAEWARTEAGTDELALTREGVAV